MAEKTEIPEWLQWGISKVTADSPSKLHAHEDAIKKNKCVEIDGGTWNAKTRTCETGNRTVESSSESSDQLLKQGL